MSSILKPETARSRWLSCLLVIALGAWLLSPLDASIPPGLDEAIEAQQAALVEDPRNASLLNDLGNLLALAGRVAEAETAYRDALGIEPDRVSARFNLGLLLQEGGRLRPARKAFEAVVKTDPDHAWAHYQLGRLLANVGRQRDAIRHYARAFRLEPRLGLPDYNPHILDNELAVQGVLGAYAGGGAAALTPRHYQHPDQVRRLLLPETAAPAEPLIEDAMDEEEASRSIGPAEIEGMPPSGQAVSTPAPGQNRSARPSRPSQPTSARDQAAERIRALRERLGVQAADEQGDEPDEGDGYEDEEQEPGASAGQSPRPSSPGAVRSAPGRQAAPGAPTFQPGVFSTGRVEQRLIPLPSHRADRSPKAG